MKALFGFLFQKPFVGSQILAASFFINLFGLATSIFVIQVYNRYLSYGNPGTLVTLVAGMGVALLLEMAFRWVRYRLAVAVVSGPGRTMGQRLFSLYTRAPIQAIEQLPPAIRLEMAYMVERLQNAFTPSNLLAMVDLPYALLFILAIYLLSPTLGAIALLLLTMIFILILIGNHIMQKRIIGMMQKQSGMNGILKSADILDTVRAFNCENLLGEQWQERSASLRLARHMVATLQERMQNITQIGGAILTITMIAIGAQQAVAGDLDFGSLIGINILAGRALAIISRFSNSSAILIRGQQTFKRLEQLEQIPVANDQGSSLGSFRGKLEFRDLAFAHPNGAGPLFESLSLTLQPGEVLIITGNNGSGKTTLARLLMGLLVPSRGQILVDGMDLRQMQLSWWRQQVIYLPQEPSFLDASIHENLTILNPEISKEKLTAIITATGLQQFISEHPEGLGHRLSDGGNKLALGMRRRLALARALVSAGKLVILDEPTEGLDQTGSRQVAEILNKLATEGVTMLLFTHDANLFKVPGRVLNLDKKPIPTLTTIAQG